MDVKEKLKDILDEFVYDEWYGNDDIAEKLMSKGVTVQEWVSTDKRKPTQEDASTEYVFTAYKNKNCYDVNISLWDTVIAFPDLYDYWMPLSLPQPPKGE